MAAADLWDLELLRQLPVRYAHAHDGRDLEALLALFTEEADALEYPEFNRVNCEQIFPAYWGAAGPSVLLVANHLVELEGADLATGSVYCLARFEMAGAWIEQAIRYEDTYQRVGEDWRFAKRRHLLWYGVALAERPLEQPKTQWPVSPVGRGSMPEELASWRAFHGIAEAPTGFYAQPSSSA